MDNNKIAAYIEQNTASDSDNIGIPYWLYQSKNYSELTLEARMVYALLLNKKYPHCLKGYDGEHEKIVINEPEKTVINMLGCRKNKAQKIIDELMSVNLIAAA